MAADPLQSGALSRPRLDPTPVFEMVRWAFGTELLAAAVHFDLFSRLAKPAMTIDQIAGDLGIARRPAVVMVVALRSMGLLGGEGEGVALTALAGEYLVPAGEFYIGDYVALIVDSPGVKAMIERLRTNEPAQSRADDPGAAFIYREGIDSAMEQEQSARRLTMALAGRARIVAPLLAERYPLPGARRLLDVGGGTGLYSVALLRANPGLSAVVWDRPEVLKVAAEMAEKYGVADRIELVAGDMFADPVPLGCDVMLLSNVLHDWDVPECERLLTRCAAALPEGGRLLIHDVYLNDAMDGPLPVALYSAALFNVTEGRAYSAGEYRGMLAKAGLEAGEIVETAVHCGVLPAMKR